MTETNPENHKAAVLSPRLIFDNENFQALLDAFSLLPMLQGMSTDDRLVFSLRFIEGLEMADVAVACDVSLSTAKRRLKDAEKHFLARAKRIAALRPWIEEGGRWAID